MVNSSEAYDGVEQRESRDVSDVRNGLANRVYHRREGLHFPVRGGNDNNTVLDESRGFTVGRLYEVLLANGIFEVVGNELFRTAVPLSRNPSDENSLDSLVQADFEERVSKIDFQNKAKLIAWINAVLSASLGAQGMFKKKIADDIGLKLFKYIDGLNPKPKTLKVTEVTAIIWDNYPDVPARAVFVPNQAIVVGSVVPDQAIVVESVVPVEVTTDPVVDVQPACEVVNRPVDREYYRVQKAFDSIARYFNLYFYKAVNKEEESET
jgi:hypothetical protein